MGHLWTNHPCYSSNTCYKKVNEDVNQIITQWLVPSLVNKKKRNERAKFLKRGYVLARVVVNKKKDRKLSIKMVTTRA